MGFVNNQNGYKLEFQSLPPFSRIMETTVTVKHTQYFNVRSITFIRKGSNRSCTFCRPSTRFLQYVFLVTKKTGDYKAVINLKPLNQYLKTQHFKMDTMKTVLNLVKKGDWAFSIDMKDDIFTF